MYNQKNSYNGRNYNSRDQTSSSFQSQNSNNSRSQQKTSINQNPYDEEERMKALDQNRNIAKEVIQKHRGNTFDKLFGDAPQEGRKSGKCCFPRDSLDNFQNQYSVNNMNSYQPGMNYELNASYDPQFENNLRRFYGRDTPVQGFKNGGDQIDDRLLRKFYGVESRGGYENNNMNRGMMNQPQLYAKAPPVRGAPQRKQPAKFEPSNEYERNAANFFGVEGYGKINDNNNYFGNKGQQSQDDEYLKYVDKFFGVEEPYQNGNIRRSQPNLRKQNNDAQPAGSRKGYQIQADKKNSFW